MDVILLCLICLVTFLLFYMWKTTGEKGSSSKSPPGPFALPVFGNLYQLAFREPHVAVTELSKHYGDVFMCNFLGQRYVIVNSARSAREALVTRKDDFAGRPRPIPYVARLTTGNGNDIVFADFGAPLIKMRKIVHSAVHVYGANLVSMEAKIGEEIEHLSETFRQKNEEPFDPGQDLCLAVLNTIFAVLFKDRYHIKDPEFQNMVKLTEFLNDMCSYENLVNQLPWLSVLPLPSLKRLREDIAYRDSVYKRKYLEHKNSFDADNIRDLTDAMIKAFIQEDEAAEDGDKQTSITEDTLLLLMNDVFVAGFETLSTTMNWVMLYMIVYPDIQKKCQDEMDRVLGRDRLPILKDRGCLPYTEGTIAEVLRVSSVFPLGVPHKAIRDTKLGGYDIPNGTGLMINHWGIHHDEKDWDEPYAFNPSRFLDEGKFAGANSRGFLPFGGGRRVCLGENLAKAELFLITSRLLHTFEFRAASGAESVNVQGVLRTTLSPKPFKLRAIARP